MGMGYWVFLSVFWACETVMYLRGHETFLFKHKTDTEKALADRKP